MNWIETKLWDYLRRKRSHVLIEINQKGWDNLRALNERLTLACNLHIEEIKRLEAERDALREQVEQVKLRRSEGSKRGWQKRRAA
jgi:hypothetical protein